MDGVGDPGAWGGPVGHDVLSGGCFGVDPRVRRRTAAGTEQLKDYPYFRATAGEYRIVFDVVDGVLRVLVIGKRDDEVCRRPR